MCERKATLILVVALLLGCRDGGEGRAAYEAGRFEEAHAAFLAAGDDASPVVLANRALAGLRAGQLRDATESAVRAAEAGDEAVVARAVFLAGSSAFAQCELAEKQASTLEAEPFAFDIAIRYGQEAMDRWQDAAMLTEDWPAARQNVERAILKLRTLRNKKAEAEKRRERKTEKEPEPNPLPGAGKEEVEAKPEDEAVIAELSDEEVLKLFERLAAKEREKIELRRSHRAKTMTSVEKDW